MESIVEFPQVISEDLTQFCPKCGNEMDRIDRSSADRFISKLVLGIVRVKRFLCLGCLWEKRVFSAYRHK
jgi:hypothetical protein